jgi:polyisoprenoid-binding protein YceI
MTMSVQWKIAVLAVATPFLIGWPMRERDPDLALQPTSRIWVNGTSNVKSFECTAAKIDVTVKTNRPDAVRAVGVGDKAVGKVDLTVPVATMDCKNGTMNDHMKEALLATDHPVIEFNLESYALLKAADSVGITLNGTLNIGGTARPVTIAAEAKDVGGGVLHVAGEYDVHMKDFGLKPPSLMLGTMRVNEMVKVHFDLLLRN